MTVTQLYKGNKHAEHNDLPYFSLDTLEQEISKETKNT
jgi:hypothetical protein